MVRELAERAYFVLCRALGRLLRSGRYAKAWIVQQDGELQVRKYRLFYAPLLVWLGGPLVRILDTGVRVLPQRDWEERERRLYRRLRGTSIRIDADGVLVLPCLAGKTLGALLDDPQLEESDRKRAIERAVAALAEFHHLGFTHGDAMAENVMVDLESGVAHWFDFETIHDSTRPMAWRRADDVRALLVTWPGPNRPREARRDPPAHPGCLCGRRSNPRSGHELHLGIAAPAHLPSRPGRVVLSVFPGDRPVAERAPRRIAPPAGGGLNAWIGLEELLAHGGGSLHT